MIVAVEPIAVAPWTRSSTISHHDEVWSAWLHGSVAAIQNAGQLLLVVPVSALTPAVVAYALRLYEVGSVQILD